MRFRKWGAQALLWAVLMLGLIFLGALAVEQAADKGYFRGVTIPQAVYENR